MRLSDLTKPMRRLSLALVLLAICAGALAEEAVTSTLSYRRLTTHDGLPQMQTEAIWQDQRGYIYIGTLSGFVRYDGRELTPLLRGRRENIVGFAEVDGHVRALGFRRQWIVDGDEVSQHPIDVEGHWLLNNFNATDLPPGMVLLEDEREEQRRLCRMTAERFEPLMADSLLDLMTPDRKLYIEGDSIFVPTPQGLYLMKGMKNEGVKSEKYGDDSGRIRLLTKHPGIFSLLRHDGALLAFADNGIYCVMRDTVAPLLPYSFEAPDYGLMARATSDGQVFIVDAHNIYQYEGDTVHRVAEGFNLIRSLFIDRWDRLWIGTYQGAYCFFNRHFTTHRLTDRNDIVRALGVTAGNHLVCGTLNGKLLFDGNIISDQPENFFAPSSAVVDGAVYMACRSDIVRVDSSGTLTWLNLPYDRYRFIAAAVNRVVFCSRQTVLAYDPVTGQTDTLSAYIRQPWCAATDGRGHLYVGSSTGVHCITSASDGQYETKRIDDGNPQFFVTTMAASPEGDIYLAAADSLFVIHDGRLAHLPLPGLQGHEVRSIYVDRHQALVVATIDRLFVARIEEGPTLADVASFDHLHGFSMIEPQQAVMAEMDDGTVWMAGLEEMTSFQPSELLADNLQDTFVAPPLAWWQRWWGIALIALAALGIITLLVSIVVRYRLRRLERDRRQKELQISAIRLKAIPHFHSNVLAGIEYFLMNGSTDNATRYLKLYSDFTNLTLTDIDRPSRSVAEEVDYARIYLQLEQLRYGERLTFDIDVDNELPIDTQIPTMVIYTYAQNAVKHGIAPKPEGGHILIRVNRQGKKAVIEVEDNGIGREAAAQLSRHSTKQGLRILMEQVALYNQRNRQQITQTVTDLRDANGNPAGTRFVMFIPLNFKFVL